MAKVTQGDLDYGALAEALARDAIRDLVARYNHHGDRGEVEAVAELFDERGVLEVAMGGPVRRASGRDGIVRLLNDISAAWAAESSGSGSPRWVRHFVSCHVIDVESSTRATGTSYVMVMRAAGIESVARYFDTYTMQQGRWLFQHRKARRDATGA